MFENPTLIGTVEKLMVNCPPDDKVAADRVQIYCSLHGIEGDKHATPVRDTSGVREREMFNRPKTEQRGTVVNWRQWSGVSEDEMMLLAEKYGLPVTKEVARRLAELVGANLLVSGIPNFTRLPGTSLLAFPSCSWLVISENLPCKGVGDQIERAYPQAKATDFPRLAMGIRGLVGMVFEAGAINVGQPIEVRRRGVELR